MSSPEELNLDRVPQPQGRVVPVLEETDQPWRPTVIDLDELREDMRDPDWQNFIQRAVAHRRRLREAGKLR